MFFTAPSTIFTKKNCFTENKICLLPEVVAEVADILEAVSEIYTCDTFKIVIIKRIGWSKEAMLQEIFNNIETGDKAPSQLLWHMKSNLGRNSMFEKILRQLWLDKPHTTTAQILALMADVMKLNKLVDTMDRIHKGHHERIMKLATTNKHKSDKIC